LVLALGAFVAIFPGSAVAVDIIEDDCSGEFFELPGGLTELAGCGEDGCRSEFVFVGCDLANGFGFYVESSPRQVTAALQFVADGVEASFRTVGVDSNGQTVSGRCVAIASGEADSSDVGLECNSRVVAIRNALLVE
jgi:hypothetical protein